MNNFVNRAYLKHKDFWSKDHFMLFLGSLAWFFLALSVQRVAYNYIDSSVNGTHVGDLLLDNLPTLNLDFFIVQAPLLLTLFVIILFLENPHYLPFSVKALSLFIIIRSFFISLTHLGVNLHQIVLDTNVIGYSVYEFLYFAKNDFFFSGHTGAPFLLGLIFWNNRVLRYLFFTASAVFGASMIFAHMHYSIDIFAAPFITYSIFVISKKLFKREYALIS